MFFGAIISLLLGLIVLWIAFQMKTKSAIITFAVLAGANFGMNFMGLMGWILRH